MTPTQDMQNSQCPPLQTPQDSQYRRGIVVGAFAACTLAASALIIHSYVHSSAQSVMCTVPLNEKAIDITTTIASTLKAIPTCFANGLLNSFTTLASFAAVTKLNDAKVIIDFGGMQSRNSWKAVLGIFALTSGASGFVSAGLSRLIRLL